MELHFTERSASVSDFFVHLKTCVYFQQYMEIRCTACAVIPVATDTHIVENPGEPRFVGLLPILFYFCS